MNVLLVLLGGVAGAVLRVGLDAVVAHRWRPTWPLATFGINVSGSLLLGGLTGLALAHGLPEPVRLLLGTGFCGAYTTFSTAAFEVVRLAQDRRVAVSAAYAVGSCLASLAAAGVGLGLTGGW